MERDVRGNHGREEKRGMKMIIWYCMHTWNSQTDTHTKRKSLRTCIYWSDTGDQERGDPCVWVPASPATLPILYSCGCKIHARSTSGQEGFPPQLPASAYSTGHTSATPAQVPTMSSLVPSAVHTCCRISYSLLQSSLSTTRFQEGKTPDLLLEESVVLAGIYM